MTRIQHTKLYFKEGNSDKVYEVEICQLGSTEFYVNFRYGRREGTLKEGTKTVTPVSLAQAQKIYDALIAEKTQKGYQTEDAFLQETPDIQTLIANKTPKEASILTRLHLEVNQPETLLDNPPSWSTSRVIWKAGELFLSEATPYLLKLIDKGDNMQRYASLWALGRMNDPSAARLLSVYFNNSKHTAEVRRIAGLGLLNCLNGPEKQAHLQFYLTRLPEALQQALAENQLDTITSILDERLLQQKSMQNEWLEHLYVLSQEYPIAIEPIRMVLSKLELAPPFFKTIRHIYKIAEHRADWVTLGLLAYRFERTSPMFIVPHPKRWHAEEEIKNPHVFVPNGGRVRYKTELKKSDSKLGFSDRTKWYFIRRNLRALKTLGTSNDPNYIRFATAILMHYDQKSDYKSAFWRNKWEYLNNRYTRYRVDYPEWSDAVMLNFILHAHSKKFHLGNGGRAWVAKEKVIDNQQNRGKSTQKPDVVKQFITWAKNLLGETVATDETNANEDVKSLSSQSEIAFPHLWDAFPQAYFLLLAEAKSEKVQVFAGTRLVSHPDFEQLRQNIDIEYIAKLLVSRYEIPRTFGLEFAKAHYAAHPEDFRLLQAMIQSEGFEVRQMGMQWAKESQYQLLQTSSIVCDFTFSPYKDVQQWLHAALSEIMLTEEVRKVCLGRILSEMNVTHTGFTQENWKNVHDIVLTHFRNEWQLLSASVVYPFISHPEEAIQQLVAAWILNQRAENIGQTPENVLDAMLNSPFASIRKAAFGIMENLTDAQLFQKSGRMMEWILSPMQDVRAAVHPLVRKLSLQHVDLGKEWMEELLPVLRHKEVYEGVHQDVCSLMLEVLTPHLSSISQSDVLRMLYGNYAPAQIFATKLLKEYIHPNALSVRQIIAMGNHETLETRHLCWYWFENNVARMRYEREEAIRLLDAKWDDSRAFAKQFFRTHFTQNDWTPEILIGIIDSVRPDIQAFGRELIQTHFESKDGDMYLLHLSQHPTVEVQLFATSYLEKYATGDIDKIAAMDHYFRSVLTRVNKGRVAKQRVIAFLEQEALKSAEAAALIAPILKEVSATVQIADKATYITLMRKIQDKYPHLELPIRKVDITHS